MHLVNPQTGKVLGNDEDWRGRLRCSTAQLLLSHQFVVVDAPAAVFFYSRDRGGEHPDQHLAGYAGLMQADAYAGFAKLYEANRKGGPIIEAACWAHARRKFFDLAINMVPSCAGHICLTRKRRCGTVICSSENSNQADAIPMPLIRDYK